jgi:hypothetical protein
MLRLHSGVRIRLVDGRWGWRVANLESVVDDLLAWNVSAVFGWE